MFENIINFFKRAGKKEEKKETANSKDAAKERLHLVLMQDRANVSADFLELMKQEIIEVIKKYIEVDENAIDVRLTNKENEDGTNGAPALYANIPILNIKNEARKVDKKEIKEQTKKEEEETIEKKAKTEESSMQKESSEKENNEKEIRKTEENTEKQENDAENIEEKQENKNQNKEAQPKTKENKQEEKIENREYKKDRKQANNKYETYKNQKRPINTEKPTTQVKIEKEKISQK